IGREEDRHRPAALTCQRDDGLHVDGVDVRPLLTVDLDVDKALVHQARGLLVLERLALHHVAPVAGRVPHGAQDRLILGTRLPEGNVDLELDVGDPVDVSVHGSHATRRVVTFSSWACTAPGARIVLRPGQRGFGVPRLMESPYEITVTSGTMRGKLMAAVFGGPQGAC